MKKFVLAGGIALATLVAAQGAGAQEICTCDCNEDGEVVISELITCVNISLGNAQVSTCPAGDPNDSGAVEINELIRGVNAANGDCQPPPMGGCGDGVTETVIGEQCDDGNNFNGDGCAGNCTNEQSVVGVFDSTKSIATVQTEAFPVIINLSGQQTFRIGALRDTDVRDPDGDVVYRRGEVPLAVRADELIFQPVRVTGLVCACVRGVPVENFGPGLAATGSLSCEDNVISDVNYLLIQDHNTTPGSEGNRLQPPAGGTANDPQCDDVSVLPGGTTSQACVEGDPNVANCRNEPGEEEEHPHIGVCNGPRVLTRSGGPAPAGSAFVLFNVAIGLLQDRGLCATNPRLPNGTCEFADYGPDCMPCTADDLEMGQAENIPLTTGRVEASTFDANNSESVQGIPGGSVEISQNGDCIGPCKTVVNGARFDCDTVLGGSLAGGSLAVGFPSIDAATIGDNVTTSVFFNQ